MSNQLTPEANEKVIAHLGRTIDTLIERVIRPMAVQAYQDRNKILVNEERLKILVTLVEEQESIKDDIHEPMQQNSDEFTTLMTELDKIGIQNRALLSALADGMVDTLEQAG